MKRKELEAALRKLGWSLDRHGKKHDVWTNGKEMYNTIPRHQEINEYTAKGILKKASLNKGKKDGN